MAEEFRGEIGPSWRESTPWWPPDPEVPEGAPNVVLVVLDDVGYAQLGCYGSDIATPNIDRLAAGGVRFANFHTTALCSPTRSCLLTGRNHHSNGMARVADLAVGFPGYWGRIPRRNGFLSETLAANGYAPVAVGKWHLTPEDETHAAAPRDSWPVGRGFQRWYGFHGGETHQFVPNLFQDNHAVLPPRTPEQGYHLSEDLAERAIQYLGEIRAVEPDQPFFLYFATGACHSPHQAPGGVDRALPRPVRRGLGRVAGGDVRAPAGDGPAPRRHRALAPPAVGAGSGSTSSRRTRRSRRGSWSASPASCPTRTRRSARLLAFIDELGERDNTIVVLVVGQRRERGRRRARLDQRRAALERQSGRSARAARAGRRARHPDRAQQLSVGLDDGGQHAVPALEARGARGRRRGSVHRALAARHRGPGRDPAPVRARDRRAPDPARPHRHRRARRARRHRAEPDRRHELRRDAALRRRGRAPHHAVLRDARQPRDLPRRLEGRDLQAARRHVQRRHRSRRAVRGRRLGAVPRRRGLLGVPRPRDRGARAARASSSTIWWEEARRSTRCSRSTTGRSRRCSTPASRSTSGTATSSGRTVRRSRRTSR